MNLMNYSWPIMTDIKVFYLEFETSETLGSTLGKTAPLE